MVLLQRGLFDFDCVEMGVRVDGRVGRRWRPRVNGDGEEEFG